MVGKKTILLLIPLGIVAILVSCSPKFSNNLLSFFFDGVPVPDTTVKSSLPEPSKEEMTGDIFRPVPIEFLKDNTIHYPYGEKDCYSCHDEKSKTELVLAQPDLCYICHEDYSQKYKAVHGPVEAGYCTSCHNPHKSERPKLLIRSGNDICLDCHEKLTVMKNVEHSDIADAECTLCHNPHGGENRFILN